MVPYTVSVYTGIYNSAWGKRVQWRRKLTQIVVYCFILKLEEGIEKKNLYSQAQTTIDVHQCKALVHVALKCNHHIMYVSYLGSSEVL